MDKCYKGHLWTYHPGFCGRLGIPVNVYSFVFCVNEFSEGADLAQWPGSYSPSFIWLSLSRLLILHFNLQKPVLMSYREHSTLDPKYEEQ